MADNVSFDPSEFQQAMPQGLMNTIPAGIVPDLSGGTPQSSAPAAPVQTMKDYTPPDWQAPDGDQWTPDWMHSIAEVESNNNPMAVSSAGAKGLYQFTDPTARDYGVQNPFVPDQAYKGANAYLNKLSKKYGDRDLAIAAYNDGPKNVDALIAKGYSKAQIIKALPAETQGEIAKVNAAHDARMQPVAFDPSEFKQQPQAQPQQQPVSFDPNEFKSPGYAKEIAGKVAGAASTFASGFANLIPYANSAQEQSMNLGISPEDQANQPKTFGELSTQQAQVAQTIQNQLDSIVPASLQTGYGEGKDLMNSAFEALNLPPTKAADYLENKGFKGAAGFIRSYGMLGWQMLLGKAMGAPRGAIANMAEDFVRSKRAPPPKEATATPSPDATATQDTMSAMGISMEPQDVPNPVPQGATPAQGPGGTGYGPESETALYDQAQADAVKRGFSPEQVNPYAADINNEFASRQGNLQLPPGNFDLRNSPGEVPNLSVESQLNNSLSALQKRQEALGAVPFEGGPSTSLGATDFNSKTLNTEPIPFDRGPFENPQGQLDLTKGPPGRAPAVLKAALEPIQGKIPFDDRVVQPDPTSNIPGKVVIKPKIRPKPMGGPNAQRGSTDLFNDLGDAVLKGVGNLKTKMDALGLQNLKAGLRNIGFGGYKAGDSVRLMDGSVGYIRSVDTSKPGQETFTVGLDNGQTAQVPLGGINYKYKFSGDIDLKENAKRFFIPGKQGGILNLGAFWKAGKEPEVAPHSPSTEGFKLSTPETLQRLYELYSKSNNITDFTNHMEEEIHNNPGFNSGLFTNAQKIWDRFEGGYRPPESPYHAMDDLAKRETVDSRPIEQAIKESGWGEKLTEKDDLPPAKESFVPSPQMAAGNRLKIGNQIYNTVYGNLMDIVNHSKARLDMLMDKKSAFNALSRPSRLKTTDAAMNWDHGPLHQELLDSGQQWPTKDQLMNRSGLNSEEANAYLKMAEGYDHIYQLAGIKEQQIPGYMHHLHEGEWRVEVYQGNKMVELKPFAWRHGANKFVEGLKGSDLRGVVKEPFNSSRAPLVEQLTALQNVFRTQKGLDPAARARVYRTMESALRGTITESMERHGVKGFLGEGGTLPENTLAQKFLNRWDNNKIMNLYDRTMMDGIRAYKNRQIIDHVVQPLYQHFTDMTEVPALNHTLNDLFAKATGLARQEVPWVERGARYLLIKSGLNPNYISSFGSGLNDLARYTRINSANLGFASKHYLFSTFGVQDMLRVHMDRVNSGLKGGDFAGAMKFYTSMNPFNLGKFLDPKDQMAYEWGKRNAFAANQYETQIMKNKAADFAFHGALNKVISDSRRGLFMAYWKYYKDLMPVQEALKAAKTAANKGMQSFAEIDTPGVFNEGTAGKLARIFNQIHLYQASRLVQNVQSLHIGKAQGASFMARATPLMSLLGLQLLLGGVNGVIGVEMYDQARKGMNALFHTNLPSPAEFAAEHLPGWMGLGAAANMLGVNVSGTFESPTLQNFFGTAGLEEGWNVSKLAYEILASSMGEGSPKDFYAAAHDVAPQTLVPWIEDYYAKQNNGTLVDRNLDTTYARTSKEDMIYKMFSTKSTSEAAFAQKRGIVEDRNARNLNWLNYRASKFIDNIRGFDQGWKNANEILNETVSAGRGFNPDDFSKMVAIKLKEEQLPWLVNYLQKTATSTNNYDKARKINDILKFYKSLPEDMNRATAQ